MADIRHRVGIKAPISKVYQALATVEGVAGWWTTTTTGESRPGGVIETRFLTKGGEEIGSMSFDVAELAPDRKVRWRVRTGPPEWLGTDIVFDLSRAGDYTIVLFSHESWKEWVEFMGHCSTKWAVFLLSLKELVETGKGRPSPDDVKIDDWN